MASHKITLTLVTTAAGQPVDQTGVMGMVMQGVAVNGMLALNQAYSLTKRADMATFGINAAYDTTNSCAVFQQISEFYDQAGDGAQLWIMVVAMNTAYATFVTTTAFSNFVKYTAQADVSRQAKIIGLCYAPPTATQSATDFPVDVTGAVTAAQTVQAQLFAQGYCFGVIVDGFNMSSTVTPSTIGTQATNSAYAVSLCITGSKGNGISAVGAALGRYARISTGHGVGAVEDGAIAITRAFLTNGLAFYAGGTALTVGNEYLVVGGTVEYNSVQYFEGNTITAVNGHTAFTTADTGYLVFDSTPIMGLGDEQNGGVTGMDPDDLDALGTKQFFFITTVQGIAGLYWNDGATCTTTDNFFCMMEYMRVACQLTYDARGFLTLLRGISLPQQVNTGALDPTFCASRAQSFKDKFIVPLTQSGGTGDITDASMTLSGPTYGVDATVKFSLSFIRSTISGPMTGTIQQVLTL